MRERTPFTAKRLASLTDLKLLVTTGMANASIDMDAAREHGVTVCGTAALPSPTAELAWGLIIGYQRNILEEDRRMREGGWQRTIGPELAGRTLGILGLGNLGRRMARDRPRVRDGGDRLEREPDRRGRRRGGRHRRRARRAVRAHATCSRSTRGSATARAGWSARASSR